jgi:CRP/FNR family transcriptional regulator, cyclic AMP receptor protein
MRKALVMMGVLDDTDAEWLGNNRTEYLPAGSILIREGHPIEDLYILLDGRLSVETRSSGNQKIASLLPGEIVGEISFVDARSPSASVIASENSHVLVVSRDLLNRKLQGDAGFAARFYRAVAILLATRLRNTVNHLGYGKWIETPDGDELDEPLMECVSLGTTRFDRLLKKLRAS